MHNHLEQSDGGDSDVFEVIGVGLPWFVILDGFLLGGVVGVEGITMGVDKFDVVIELYD